MKYLATNKKQKKLSSEIFKLSIINIYIIKIIIKFYIKDS